MTSELSKADLDKLLQKRLTDNAASGAASGASSSASGIASGIANGTADDNPQDPALPNFANPIKPKKTKKIKEKPISETGWSLDDFRFPACILSVGKPRSGKTYLTRFLLTYFCKTDPVFKGGLVMTGSRDLNDDYDFLPSKAIINGYDEDLLKRHVDKLQAYRKRTGQPPPASFIVFDDLLGKLQGSAFFNNFISIYRHLNITIFINVQYMKTRASNTLLRECVKYAFVFKTTTKISLQCIYEVIGQLFDSFEEFKAHFLKVTSKPHAACLYIADRDNPEENYFEAIAPEHYKQQQIEFE